MTPSKLLFADPQGKVLEHPKLLATVRSGEALSGPWEAPIPLPVGAKLVHLPGRVPVGVDPETGELELLREVKVGRRRFAPTAVGAVLPPGYTRTFLPGEVKGEGPLLPQWAYTAAAWSERGAVVWALRTDRRTHWDPKRFSTPDLKGRVTALQKRFPENPVIEQLTKCALVYRCSTSQNSFYLRDEGALPASVACNAQCVGCISEQPEEGPPASHQRISQGPSAQQLAEVGGHHLARATGRVMVSFGQGCEGEPLTRYRVLAESIRLMRSATARGSINLNTNASLPHGLEALLGAGLDAVRVSLNSACADLYAAYYRPVGYGFEQVEASIALARKRGIYVALNLLILPGVTDRAGEVEALIGLVRRHRVDQIQARSLCLDPLSYLEVAGNLGAGGEPMGIRAMLAALRRAAPWLSIGNFARGRDER
jgi:wyosine [tRNA(Phe)-imidazoG37] synthetase (radical SAM superfamily)